MPSTPTATTLADHFEIGGGLPVYLSGPWEKRSYLRMQARMLRQAGFTIVARWLGLGEDVPRRDDRVEPHWPPTNPEDELALARIACDDLLDVQAARFFLAYTEGPESVFRRGGRHVEYGVALSCLKTFVAVVGPRENIFHWVPSRAGCSHLMGHFDSTLDFIVAYRDGRLIPPSLTGRTADGPPTNTDTASG